MTPSAQAQVIYFENHLVFINQKIFMELIISNSKMLDVKLLLKFSPISQLFDN